jgi:hypothetical protein
VVTTIVCFIFSHAMLRVRRAPGFPCALNSGGPKIAARLGAHHAAGSWNDALGSLLCDERELLVK